MYALLKTFPVALIFSTPTALLMPKFQNRNKYLQLYECIRNIK